MGIFTAGAQNAQPDSVRERTFMFAELAVARLSRELQHPKYAQFYVRMLHGLMEHVLAAKPDTIFTMDVSGRPVAWMLRQMLHELRSQGQIDTGYRPSLRYINLDRNTLGESGLRNGTQDGIRRRYTHVGTSIMILDEYSDKADGGSSFARHAASAIRSAFGMNQHNVSAYVLFARDRPPGFRFIEDSIKRTVYGIADPLPDQAASTAIKGRSSEERLLAERYRQLFYDIGRQAAQEYRSAA